MVVEQVLAVTSTGVRTKTGNKVAIGNASFSVGEMVAVTDGYVIKHQQIGNSSMMQKRDSACIYAVSFDDDGYLTATAYDVKTLKLKKTFTSKIAKADVGTTTLYLGGDEILAGNGKQIKGGKVVEKFDNIYDCYYDSGGARHCCCLNSDWDCTIYTGSNVSKCSFATAYSRVYNHRFSEGTVKDRETETGISNFDGKYVYMYIELDAILETWTMKAYAVMARNGTIIANTGDLDWWSDVPSYTFKSTRNDGNITITTHYGFEDDEYKWSFGGKTGTSEPYDMLDYRDNHLILTSAGLQNLDSKASISYSGRNIGISTIKNIKKMLGA